ncbi:MAG: S41 family peptidase [Candidatus Zixiibacteriota bacterium]
MRFFLSLFGSLLFLLCILITTGEGSDIQYARYPALSPNGMTIAFSYQGDLWTVPATGGEAVRLTVHEADDIQPHYSPDGKSILFSSRRYGNYDIFVMPSDGGVPRQLTVHSENDFGSGWSPEGDTVLFYSSREGWNDIYKVAITGGTPIKLTGYYKSHESFGRMTSDHNLIFHFGAGVRRWWRRDLQSSRNGDIYLQDRSKTPFTSMRLTFNESHDVWPVLNEEAHELYFVSCRGDWAQVWKKPMNGGDAVALTDFTGDGVQWLNGNPQGTMLVFEQGFKIWTLNPATGELKQVPIDIKSDERDNLIGPKSFNGDVQWYDLSPDEKKIAVTVHGEIFVIPAEDPERGFRVTHTPARESHPVWGMDSRTLYYSSDRSGNADIYSVDVTTGNEKQLTSDQENETRPSISPDGKYLIFYRGLDKLIRYDIENEFEVLWVDGMFIDFALEPTIEFDWSPDSKWLAFTMGGPTYETDIYVVDLHGGRYNVSQFSGYNYRPRFSADGKKIYFSRSNDGKTSTYEIALTHEPEEYYESEFDSLFMEPADGDKDEKDEAHKKDTAISVEIDFTRIDQRRKLAYSLTASSDYPLLAPDGEQYVFVANILDKPEIWTVKTDDKPELTQITKGGGGKSNLILNKDGKTVYYLEGGKIKSVSIDGKDSETLSFTAEMDIDEQLLNRQKFTESWQMLNTYFYDGDFHGTNWAAVREKYEPIVPSVRTETEFNNLIKEMLGELRASHLDIFSDLGSPDGQIVTGETGILLDFELLDKDGVFRIKDIVPESPAHLGGLKTGDYIFAVNGELLSPSSNFFSLMAGSQGRRMTFEIGDKPNAKIDKRREITIKPISRGDAGTLIYNEWVEHKRRIVDSLSHGRLAYVHIRAMSGRYLEQFKDEMVSLAEHKDGVIIDVRDNGGGNIAVHLLGILVKTPYFYRNFRDFPPTTENKLRSDALEKPTALLINSYSASNSEIFAEGFRQLHLGKIIGEPTAGAVIGTGSYTLIDGTRIRRPSWGAITIENEDTDKIRRYPDIEIILGPDDFINDRDLQIQRAVEELMKELQ